MHTDKRTIKKIWIQTKEQIFNTYRIFYRCPRCLSVVIFKRLEIEFLFDRFVFYSRVRTYDNIPKLSRKKNAVHLRHDDFGNSTPRFRNSSRFLKNKMHHNLSQEIIRDRKSSCNRRKIASPRPRLAPPLRFYGKISFLCCRPVGDLFPTWLCL